MLWGHLVICHGPWWPLVCGFEPQSPCGIIPPVGTEGDLYHHRAERMGFEPTHPLWVPTVGLLNRRIVERSLSPKRSKWDGIRTEHPKWVPTVELLFYNPAERVGFELLSPVGDTYPLWVQVGTYIIIVRRGWVSSQQLISSPKAAEVALTADLINLMIDL
jgi:hypothetical protein